MTEFWGKHAIFDCSGCCDGIKDRDVIYLFVKELVPAINMVAYGEPQIVHFAAHDPSKGGYTLTQLIETSLIDGHFVDETLEAYISVHSCKDFDEIVVDGLIGKYFQPKNIVKRIIFRGEKNNVNNS
jgi:S-adenosylmethionine/arginine decarboxylase-like enzyme